MRNAAALCLGSLILGAAAAVVCWPWLRDERAATAPPAHTESPAPLPAPEAPMAVGAMAAHGAQVPVSTIELLREMPEDLASGRVRVRVVHDDSGEPVTDFAVRLEAAAAAATHEDPPAEPPQSAERVQREDGEHLLRTEWIGPHWLLVWAVGCVPVAVRCDVRPDAGNDVEVRVARGVELGGIVVDAGGRPVENGFVTVLAPGQSDGPGAETGEGGAFRLPPLAPGFYRLLVESPRRPSLVHGPVQVDPARPQQALRLQLPAGATLRGAVAGWRPEDSVRVVCEDATGLERSAVVGFGGLYSIPGLSPGVQAVRLETEAGEVLADFAPVLLAAGELRDLDIAYPGR